MSSRFLRVPLFTGNFNYTRDGATQALVRLVRYLREERRATVRIYAPTAPEAPEVEGLAAVPSLALPGRSEYRLGLGMTPALRREVFADAFDALSARREGSRALVVGDGPARAWMSERMPTAAFTGFLGGTDLARAVASADVLLNPSATEAFGSVTLEAMASGLPVVSADVPAARVLVRHEETGLLCPPADAAGYAAALLRMAERPAWRARLGAAPTPPAAPSAGK